MYCEAPDCYNEVDLDHATCSKHGSVLHSEKWGGDDDDLDDDEPDFTVDPVRIRLTRTGKPDQVPQVDPQ